MVKVRKNVGELRAANKKVFRQIARKFDTALRQTIQEPRQWAGFEGSKTFRANGSVVTGSFRNIEDLGNLANSQKMELNGLTAIYSWDGNGVTPVATVFFGARTQNGFIPGRDWVTPTIAEFTFD